MPSCFGFCGAGCPGTPPPPPTSWASPPLPPLQAHLPLTSPRATSSHARLEWPLCTHSHTLHLHPGLSGDTQVWTSGLRCAVSTWTPPSTATFSVYLKPNPPDLSPKATSSPAGYHHLSLKYTRHPGANIHASLSHPPPTIQHSAVSISPSKCLSNVQLKETQDSEIKQCRNRNSLTIKLDSTKGIQWRKCLLCQVFQHFAIYILMWILFHWTKPSVSQKEEKKTRQLLSDTSHFNQHRKKVGFFWPPQGCWSPGLNGSACWQLFSAPKRSHAIKCYGTSFWAGKPCTLFHLWI